MESNLVELKAMIAAAFAAIAGFLGWFGIMVVLYSVAMALDFITGSWRAMKRGEWNSRRAREGANEKFGSVIVVGVAGMVDIMISLILKNFPSIPLPFSAVFCLLAIVWYTLTEFGSIIENLGEIGVHIPKFLRKALSVFQASVDKIADGAMGEDHEPEEKKQEEERKSESC